MVTGTSVFSHYVCPPPLENTGGARGPVALCELQTITLGFVTQGFPCRSFPVLRPHQPLLGLFFLGFGGILTCFFVLPSRGRPRRALPPWDARAPMDGALLVEGLLRHAGTSYVIQAAPASCGMRCPSSAALRGLGPRACGQNQIPTDGIEEIERTSREGLKKNISGGC